MIVATDIKKIVRMVGDGKDPTTMPVELNGIELTAHVLTEEQEAEYAALPTDRSGSKFDGSKFESVPRSMEETQAKLKRTYTEVVQARLDAVARSRGYDNIFTAVTYADEPSVPSFQADGKAFRKWRSLVWDACNQILSDVTSGRRALPTTDALLSELPSFVL